MVKKQSAPDAVTGQSKLTGHEITDKKGYAQRWGFCTRTCDNLLSQGMPHLAVGKRRVRIVVAEADAWMREKFATRRIGPALAEREANAEAEGAK